MRAFSTVKDRPVWLTCLPVDSSRITSTDSSSISSRVPAGGQCSPVMCSLSASPVPRPSTNRPLHCTALVAAACAITAGWIRTMGQVTAVVIGSEHA